MRVVSMDRHTGRDSRYDDTAEAYPDLEFPDETESGEPLSGAPARVAVVKVLGVVRRGNPIDVDTHPHGYGDVDFGCWLIL